MFLQTAIKGQTRLFLGLLCLNVYFIAIYRSDYKQQSKIKTFKNNLP